MRSTTLASLINRRIAAIGLLLALCGSAALSAQILNQQDFDIVAFKYDTGESVSDTPQGILANPAPISDGAVNFMLLNDMVPLYLANGPTNSGTVAFGYVDSSVWTPANADGNDLTVDFNSVGDRIYVTLDGSGNLELISAANLQSGQVIDTASITLDPDKPFQLIVTEGVNWAEVLYDGQVVAEGDPFLGGSTAVRANVGDDFVVSVLAGPMEDGAATINQLASTAHLVPYEFPRVIPSHPGHAPRPALRVPRSGDVLDSTELADLEIRITNQGSTVASAVDITLVVPVADGFSITGPSTRNYGDIPPGATVGRIFQVATSSTDPGVYPLTLNATGGLTQTLTTWVPVWEMTPTLTDAIAGVADATLDTPFGTHEVAVIAPEHHDQDGNPTHFDLQKVTHRVQHAVPFLGVQQGDGAFEVSAPRASIASRARGGTGNIVGSIRKLVPGTTRPPVDGAVVTLKSLDTGATSTMKTGSDGVYVFGPVPYGGYQIIVRPPTSLRKSGRTTTSAPFELGVSVLTLDPFLFTCPPVNSAPAPTAPPPNAQGATVPARPAPPKKTGISPRAKSMAAGTGASIAVGLIDIAVSPKTLGGSLLSLFAGAAAGAGTNLAVDPQDQDLFYVGRNNTPPASQAEVTMEESVVVDVTIAPALSFTAPSTITTTYTYERVTDQQTYTYSSGESLTFDKYLPLVVRVIPFNDGGADMLRLEVEPFTPGNEPLAGAEVFVRAWLMTADTLELELGQAVLRDEGTEADAQAGDGIYTAVLADPGSAELMVLASRAGFLPKNSPAFTGFHRSSLGTGIAIFSDGFESGDLTAWQ